MDPTAGEVDPRRAPASPALLSLVTRMNVGGPARQLLLLHKGLPARLGALVAAGRPPAHEGELADPDVPVRHLPLVRPVRPLTDLAALAAITRLLARTRPGVLHTHMAKAGALGRLAALSAGRHPRLVHTFHGHVLQGYFGAGQQEAFLRLERWLARRTDVLVAVSTEVRDELLDLRIGRPAQYEVIRLGVDLEPFLAAGDRVGRLRSAIGVGPDVPLAGVVGRLVPIKDHDALLEAVAQVPALHLAVLGDGERRHDLERRAHELGLAARVHFAGWWHDMPGALADLDLVALASRNEGTPVALIEALAAGRPVVATDVGGVPSVVEDGRTGWLRPAGDCRGLAEAMREVLARPDLARDRAALGRERVAARFGAARMVADHVALYDELLGRRR